MHNILELEVALASTPWACEPNALAGLPARLRAAPPRRAGLAGVRGGRRPSGRTAVIGIVGPIQQHAGLFEMLGIGVSCDTISRQLKMAMADPGCDRVILDCDSPGGSIFGLAELAAEIRAARNVKPVVAIANSLCASACYWIASACTELYVTPSGQVGSIGVIAAHEDVSKALEAEGVRVTLIAAGRFKTEGNSFAPLGREARAAMQADVDGYGSDFLRDVAAGRGVSVDTVRRTFGEGRMMRGADAVRVGAADGVATLDDVLRGRARSPKARIDAVTLNRMPAALARSLRMLALLDD